jgi:pSer/pThr/pTyr-binding forkhead associated (FHA) protein
MPSIAHRVVRPAPGRYLALAEGAEVVFFAMEGQVTRVGRSRSADLFLDDTTVSRSHALFVRRGDAVHVLDDHSLNGVWVNGVRVADAELTDGDDVVLGRVSLRFVDVRAAEAPLSAPAP